MFINNEIKSTFLSEGTKKRIASVRGMNINKTYQFLLSKYRADRFEGRNCKYCPDYSLRVCLSKLESIQSNGFFGISRHENISGFPEWFNENLEPIDPIFPKNKKNINKQYS